jgi:hypothetical protein
VFDLQTSSGGKHSLFHLNNEISRLFSPISINRGQTEESSLTTKAAVANHKISLSQIIASVRNPLFFCPQNNKSSNTRLTKNERKNFFLENLFHVEGGRVGKGADER